MDLTLANVASLMQTETGYTPMVESDILRDTVLFMGEEQDSFYTRSLISISNKLIVELFGINNAIRRKNGKEKFTEYPIITSMSDTLPFEYQAIEGMFVYGLAYWLFMQDEEWIKANAMLQQFNAMKQQFAPCLYTKVRRTY